MSAKLNNIKRQLVDIVNEAQKFKNTSNITEEQVFQFNKYSMELKYFLQAYSHNDMIKERIDKIEEVIYEDNDLRLWVQALLVIFVVPHLVLVIQNHAKKNKCQREILEVGSLYSSIEFLFRNYEE